MYGVLGAFELGSHPNLAAAGKPQKVGTTVGWAPSQARVSTTINPRESEPDKRGFLALPDVTTSAKPGRAGVSVPMMVLDRSAPGCLAVWAASRGLRFSERLAYLVKARRADRQTSAQSGRAGNPFR
jgi:hypothetical protein